MGTPFEGLHKNETAWARSEHTPRPREFGREGERERGREGERERGRGGCLSPAVLLEAIQKLMEDRRLQTGGNNDLILPQASLARSERTSSFG